MTFAQSLLLTLPFLVFGPTSVTYSDIPVPPNTAAEARADAEEDAELFDPFEKKEEPELRQTIWDPLEKFNRVIFKVNDKLYFWILKPVSTGYSKVLPQKVRMSVRKVFTNATSGVRVANSLVQCRFKDAGRETARFLLNTTAGIGGLFDPASHTLGYRTTQANFDQTLGRYRVGNGPYVVWPVLGPSSARGTVGFTVDSFLKPWPYFLGTLENLGVSAGETVNSTSLNLGEYEQLLNSSIDPYVAIRNGYFQWTASMVKRVTK